MFQKVKSFGGGAIVGLLLNIFQAPLNSLNIYYVLCIILLCLSIVRVQFVILN